MLIKSRACCRRPIFIISLGIVILLAVGGGGPSRADLIPVVEAEPRKPPAEEPSGFPGLKFKTRAAVSADYNPWPGRMIGAGQDTPRSLFYQDWPHRSGSFELHLDDKYTLARMICGLPISAAT
jgi:hypothetical protein